MYPKNSGFTLIEMMVAMTVAAILLTIAIPSFTHMIDQNRLKGAAEMLYADLRFARAEAIMRNKPVQVSFNVNSSTWCYGLRVNANCDCQVTDPTNSGYCEIDNVPKIVSSAEFSGASISGTAHDPES